MKPLRCAAAALLVSVPLAGCAAPFDGSQSIDAWNGLIVSFTRVTGLAGAYVGAAEGQDGAVFNPAATAHRERNLDRGWDWDFVLNWLLPGVDPTGWSFWREQLVLGVDVAGVVGGVGYAAAGAGFREVEYGAYAHLRLGGLWKPRGEQWRIGLLLDPGQTIQRRDPAATLPVVAVPRAFASPWTISVGGSILLGRNARLYNEPPPVALRAHPEWGPGPASEPDGSQPVMATWQVDMVGPTGNAVSPLSFLHQQTEAAVASGARVCLEPHLGLEWTAIDRWLVVRGGSYLEPSRVGASPRLHATLGAQARIPIWSLVDLRPAFAADVAPRYSNFSLGIGLWHDLTPRAPLPSE